MNKDDVRAKIEEMKSLTYKNEDSYWEFTLFLEAFITSIADTPLKIYKTTLESQKDELRDGRHIKYGIQFEKSKDLVLKEMNNMLGSMAIS